MTLISSSSIIYILILYKKQRLTTRWSFTFLVCNNNNKWFSVSSCLFVHKSRLSSFCPIFLYKLLNRSKGTNYLFHLVGHLNFYLLIDMLNNCLDIALLASLRKALKVFSSLSVSFEFLHIHSWWRFALAPIEMYLVYICTVYAFCHVV